MFITKKAISRRTVLRGMGATIALPLLESMVPAFTATAQTPAANVAKRFGSIYLPHGYIMDMWKPETAGTGFEFKPINKPLEPLRDRIVLMTGLASPQNGGDGQHATAPVSFLSGVAPRQTEGSDIHAGETIDQMLGKRIGQDTTFPTLEIATEDFSTAIGACEVGYSCAYLNTISWASSTVPLPMEINPRVLFERMFGAGRNPEERAVRRREDASILDAVRQQAARLEGGVGTRDRSTIREYLDNVREIERRIQLAEKQNASNPNLAVGAPAGVPDDWTEHVRLMFELWRVAYQSDMTRVVSFMMARDLHSGNYNHIGVPQGHHALSHHNFRQEEMANFAKINTYHHVLVGEFLQKMRDTPDGDGSLLDHSLMMFGNGMSIGTVHSRVDLPYVFAGGGIKGGRYQIEPKETPIGNVLVTIAQKLGVDIERFGESTGAVTL
jgi:hypothetical protein